MTAIAFLAGCTINGKAFGAPSKTSTPTAAPAAEEDPENMPSPPRPDRPPLPRQPDSPDDPKGAIDRFEALPKRIADPWEAVVNDQPRWRFGPAFDRWGVVGVVDRVDLEMGFVYIKVHEDPLWLTSVRVAVLSWRIGGKVQIVGSKKRDQLAVSAKDVFLP